MCLCVSYYLDLPPRDANASAALLARAQARGWLDARTAAVYVDYTLYNPELSRIVAIELSLELPETGMGLPHSRVTVLPNARFLMDGFFRALPWSAADATRVPAMSLMPSAGFAIALALTLYFTLKVRQGKIVQCAFSDAVSQQREENTNGTPLSLDCALIE